MKIKSTITICRTHGDHSEAMPVHITLVDETSRIRFFEGNMRLEDFSSALLGLSGLEIDGEVTGLENVGKRKITENRKIVCPLTVYDRDILGKWLAENAKEDGWIVQTYLGSKGQVKHHPDGQMLCYTVVKYVGDSEPKTKHLHHSHKPAITQPWPAPNPPCPARLPPSTPV